MVKATAPLTPRQVLGNQRRFQRLSIDEACAALLALLSGVRVVPPKGELRKIASTIRRRRPASALPSKEVRHG